jgi:hypothetical protein
VDVRAAVAELTERRPAEAEQGLCDLAGIASTTTATDLAGGVLDIATTMLADQTTVRGLQQDGGWAGAVRALVERWPVLEPGPDDPPGVTALTALLAETPQRELAALPDTFLAERWVVLPLGQTVLAEERGGLLRPAEPPGERLVVELLHWAVAAATRPPATRLDWRQTGAQRRDAAVELPVAVTDLWVRAEVDEKSGHYQVGPGPREVPSYVRDHPLRFGRTASLAGAVLLAEHAAAECVANLATLRTWGEFRLFLPRPVAADAAPTLREVLLAARDDGDDRVVDLLDVAATVAHLANHELSFTGPAAGHFALGTPDTGSRLGTVTGLLVDDRSLPWTRIGEAANTAAVDAPAYRRHLLRQRAGLDPLAECFLVAADGVAAGPAEAWIRYAAGRDAVQAANLEVLASDPVDRYRGEGIAGWVRELPSSPHGLAEYVEAWWSIRRNRDTPGGGDATG